MVSDDVGRSIGAVNNLGKKVFGLRVRVKMPVSVKGFVIGHQSFGLNLLTLNQTGFVTLTQKPLSLFGSDVTVMKN